MNFYLIGIKGTGMSALACYLKDMGHNVLGSDTSDTFFTDEVLKEKMIKVSIYNKENITNKFIYIIGLSVDKENPEFKEVLDKDLEYYYYNEFINEFIDKKIIAVSGTHGKTTTAHLIKEISNISSIIGCGEGSFNDSKYLVLEACEYKNHFYSYQPELLIIQSLDLDHPDFFKSKKQLIASFNHVANNSKIVLINGDDKNSKYIIHKNKITYGFNTSNDYIIEIVNESKEGYMFNLKGKNFCRPLKCNLVGYHNLYNYVAAYLACSILNIKVKQYMPLTLPIRRMTTYRYGNTILIDDYAHHPTEIDNLLSAVKIKYPGYYIKTIFQSHTYSRTLYLKSKFKKVLKKFDDVYLMDVFPSSREEKNALLQKKVDHYFKKFKKYNSDIINSINKDSRDVWIFLGAGVANKLINKNKNDIIIL